MIQNKVSLSKLPIDPYLEQIKSSLVKNNNLVISASPGSGKTTRIPPALVDSTDKKILVLEPRRIAAVVSCQRIAEENNWQLGREIGYEVRLENQVSANTKIIFITEAILIKKILSDPSLNDFGIIILDEFHERSIHTDLAIGLLKELQQLDRPDLKIIVMSATLNTQQVSKFLNAEVFDVAIPPFELKIIHHTKSLSRTMNEDFYQKTIDTLKTAIQNGTQSILIFLPGKGEISKLAQKIVSLDLKNYQIVELHGSLSLSEQKKALQNNGIKKIILATNIAESSLTVDGVDTVIDCGVARSSSFNVKTNTNKLELVQISQFSAKQRQGRANRQKNGICYKLWTKLDEQGQIIADVPEILRSDLSETILNLKKLGIQNLDRFSWYEKPDSNLILYALNQLQNLNFLDQNQNLTLSGEQALHFNLPLFLSKLYIEFIKNNKIDEGCFWVTLIYEKQNLRIENNLAEYLQDKEKFLHNSLFKKSYDQLYKKSQSFAKTYLTQHNAKQVIELTTSAINNNITNLIQVDNVNLAETETHFMRALTHLICKKRPSQPGSALNFNGKGIQFTVKPTHDKSTESFQYFVALDFIELQSSSDLNCSLYFSLTDKNVETHLSDKFTKKVTLAYQQEKQKFLKTEDLFIGSILIKSKILGEPSSHEIADQISQISKLEIKKYFDQNEKLSQWLMRYKIMQKHRPDIFEDLNDDFWTKLSDYSSLGKTNITEILNTDFLNILPQIIGQELFQIMQKELPTSFSSPKGRIIYINYDEAGNAQAQSRLQDFFGIQKHPTILSGSKPIVLTLLAPSGRPIQITSDIVGFWTSSYPEIRKEMKGRYPKHDW